MNSLQTDIKYPTKTRPTINKLTMSSSNIQPTQAVNSVSSGDTVTQCHFPASSYSSPVANRCREDAPALQAPGAPRRRVGPVRRLFSD